MEDNEARSKQAEGVGNQLKELQDKQTENDKEEQKKVKEENERHDARIENIKSEFVRIRAEDKAKR